MKTALFISIAAVAMLMCSCTKEQDDLVTPKPTVDLTNKVTVKTSSNGIAIGLSFPYEGTDNLITRATEWDTTFDYTTPVYFQAYRNYYIDCDSIIQSQNNQLSGWFKAEIYFEGKLIKDTTVYTPTYANSANSYLVATLEYTK